MYEDYMQNLVGMRMSPMQSTYDDMMSNNSFCPYCSDMQNSCQYGCQHQGTPYGMYSTEFRQATPNLNVDLESMYPDIYNIIYPMIRKACMSNTRPLSRETIDGMTQDIYSNIEAGNIINLNINVDNSTFENNRGGEDAKEKAEVKVENRNVENRQMNTTMRDLIRILLIRELLSGMNNQNIFRPIPNRPNMPPPPPGGWRPMGPNPIMPRY